MDNQSNSNASVQTLFTSSWRFSVLGTTLSSVGVFGACTSFLFMTEVLTLTGVVVVPWLALIAAIAFLCISICGVAILRTKGREFFRKAETLVAPQANAGPVPPIVQGGISELQNKIELLNGRNSELEKQKRDTELAAKVSNFKLNNLGIIAGTQLAIASIEEFRENYDNKKPKTARELTDARVKAMSALGALNEAIGRDATGLTEQDKATFTNHIQSAINDLKCTNDEIEFSGRWVACGDYIYELGNNRQSQIFCASLLGADGGKLSKLMGNIRKIAEGVKQSEKSKDLSLPASLFSDLFDSLNPTECQDKRISVLLAEMGKSVYGKLQSFANSTAKKSLQEKVINYMASAQGFLSSFPKFSFSNTGVRTSSTGKQAKFYLALIDCNFDAIDLLKEGTTDFVFIVKQTELGSRPSLPKSALDGKAGPSVRELLLAAVEKVMEDEREVRKFLTQKGAEQPNPPPEVPEQPEGQQLQAPEGQPEAV